MKKRNGFTLIELLAVIVILSVLMLIAVPGILKIMNDTKADAFIAQAQSILKAAEQQYVVDQTGGGSTDIYCATKTSKTATAAPVASSSLSLTGSTKVGYYVKFSTDGQAVEFFVTDGTYSITKSVSGGISVSDLDAPDSTVVASLASCVLPS